MMPRLEATERLAAITDGAIAAGNMDRFDAGRITRKLEEAMLGEGGQRGKVAKANPAQLAEMGIGLSGAAATPKGPVSDV